MLLPEVAHSLRAQSQLAHREDQDTLVPQVSPAMKARDHKGPSSDGADDGLPLIPVAHALRGEGFDASEDGTGRGTPLVPVAFDTTQITSAANYSKPKPGDPCHPLAAGAHPPAIAYGIQAGALRENPDSGPDGVGVQEGHAYTLEARAEVQAVAFTHSGYSNKPAWVTGDRTDAIPAAGHHPSSHQGIGVFTPWAVRRLTPTECERLMGFSPVVQCVRIDVCSDDRSPGHANAEARCTIGPNSASPADASASAPHAESADQRSTTHHHDQEPVAVLHVSLDSGRGEVRISSAGRCLWSASTAAEQSASPLPMPAADFARLIVRLTESAAKGTPHGRAASPRNMTHSTAPGSGSWSVTVSGREIADAVADAAIATARQNHSTKSTTLRCDQGSQSCEQTLKTLSCSVVDAIASFIPETTRAGSSYAVTVERCEDWTAIPYRGKPADACPDGPRYKALGNSWAVNCGELVFDRLRMVEETWPVEIAEAAE